MVSRCNSFSLWAALLTLPVLALVAGSANPAAITWVGDDATNPNYWDIATTPNWTGDASVYNEGDAATFDGTSTNMDPVDLRTTLSPGSVAVSADRDYTFAGTGKLAGATGITKSGSGILTIDTSNAFEGAVNIDGGMLRLGDSNALSGTDTDAGTFVNNGGTLDLYGKYVSVAETITVAAGGTVINTFNATAQVDTLVLTGNATFGGSERLEIRGTPSFGNYTLTVDHSGNGAPGNYDAVRITNVPIHDLMDAHVVQGTLAFHNSGLGNAAGTITVDDNPGAEYVTTLQLMDSSSPYTNDVTKNLAFTGGRLYDYRGQFTIHGAVTLNDMATEIYVHTYHTTYLTSMTIADAITGDGGITKTGASSLTLQGANTYSGNTTVSTGSLILGAEAGISNSPVIDVQSGATLDVSAIVAGLQLAGTQTLKGDGTVVGDVLAASGSRVEPGSSIGALTIDGDLTLDGTLDVEYDGATIDMLTVNGDLDLGGGTFDFSQYGAALTEESYVFLTFTGTRTGKASGAAPAGYQVKYDDAGGTISLAVPEPSTLVLLALGLSFLAACVRCRP